MMGAAFVVAAVWLASAAVSQGVVFTLQDDNSTVAIEVDSQLGMHDWIIDGVNVLPPAGGGITDFRQWFWYRLGTSAEASVDTLTRGATGTTDTDFNGDADTLFVPYSGSGFEFRIRMKLDGGAAGTGLSDIAEQIEIRNTGTETLSLSFFQYGDLDLGAPDEMVSFPNSNAVLESGPLGQVLETVHTPVATHHEAAAFSSQIDAFNDGDADDLSDTPAIGGAAIGPGDITWAFQWDVALAPGGSFLISKDKHVTIPEPSTALLVALGGAVCCWLRGRTR